jgi:hypothetical protein
VEGIEEQQPLADNDKLRASAMLGMYAGQTLVQLASGIGQEELEGEGLKALRARVGEELGAALMQDAELVIQKDPDGIPDVASLRLFVLTPDAMVRLVHNVYLEGRKDGSV